MPRELPADVHRLVARRDELDRIHAAAGPDGSRVVLITGTPGVGKSALAVHYAHQARERFPDGQLFLKLHGFDSEEPLRPSAALERALRSLGVPGAEVPESQDERTALFRSTIADRRILILADDASSAAQVEPLVPPQPTSLLVVTSRSTLRGLPSSTTRVPLGLLAPDDAEELIRTLLRDSRPPDEPCHIASLARRCAHLPLALCLAADRAAASPAMPLLELIEDLRAETLWETLSPDGDARGAESVRSIFTSSYRALPAAPARTFRLLAHHPGPDFGTHLASALLAQPRERVRRLLDALTNTHMIAQTNPDRFQFHDLLRAFAVNQPDLDDSSRETHDALLRALHWYLDGAKQLAGATQRLFNPHPPADASAIRFATEAEARAWFHLERANLLAAIEAAYRHGHDTLTWQLADTLNPVYDAASAIDDWKRAAELGLQAAARLEDTAARGRMLTMTACAQHATGNFDAAVTLHRQAGHCYHAAGEELRRLQTSNCIGLIHLECRALDAALEDFTETLALARAAGLELWTAIARDNIAATHKEALALEPAVTLAHEALTTYTRIGVDGQIMAVPLLHLARIHRENTRFDEAGHYLARAEAVLPDPAIHLAITCDAFLERAALETARENLDVAERIYRQCIDYQRTLGHRAREAAARAGLGNICRQRGHPARAVDLHRQAARLRRNLPDRYLLALSLTELASALEECGEHSEARECRVQAREFLLDMGDPRAARLLASLELCV